MKQETCNPALAGKGPNAIRSITARVHRAARRCGSCVAAYGARAAGGPCSDEPLLLEAGGFRLELPLSVIPNCADLALSQALWTFMR